MGQHYRDRSDAENNFDELKNQWGWSGFTTHDLKRCQIMARTIALVYNWWSLFTRLAIPEMKKRGGGVILHIAARSGMLGQSGRAAYCASKGGMVRLTEAMAMDHAKDKIRVNCICPGPTRTPMVDTSTPERLAHYKRRVPIGRIGEPEDIAYAALYLASGEASMVTAAILPVDGGMRLTGA